MSGEDVRIVIIALIAGFPGLVGALIAAYLQLRGLKAVVQTTVSTDLKVADLKDRQVITDANVQKIEKATNNMHDALVKVTGDEALLRGIAIGTQEERANPLVAVPTTPPA